MHRALEQITDIDVLRRMVAHNIEVIAVQDAAISERDRQLATLSTSHAQALSERDTEIAKRDHEIHFKTAKIEHLTQVIKNLQRLEFAARSERFDPAQRALFDAALQADLAAAETELQSGWRTA